MPMSAPWSAPWWPEGQFNLALILGELYYYDEAIEHMQDFLALVPDAPNAQHWQDQVYRWQGELRSIRGASNRRTRTVAAR
jgi:tetratricopeptide (TPR) repeat protein